MIPTHGYLCVCFFLLLFTMPYDSGLIFSRIKFDTSVDYIFILYLETKLYLVNILIPLSFKYHELNGRLRKMKEKYLRSYLSYMRIHLLLIRNNIIILLFFFHEKYLMGRHHWYLENEYASHYAFFLINKHKKEAILLETKNRAFLIYR